MSAQHNDPKDVLEASLDEFQMAFETPNDVNLWIKLLTEEVMEAEEVAEQLLKETCDMVYVMTGLSRVIKKLGMNPNEVAPIMDHLAPRMAFILYRCEDIYPDAVFQEAFERVHASNMSKLDPDTGLPVRREDGKVLKGPAYAPPILDDLVERAAEENYGE